jgi:hypothetical protein
MLSTEAVCTCELLAGRCGEAGRLRLPVREGDKDDAETAAEELADLPEKEEGRIVAEAAATAAEAASSPVAVSVARGAASGRCSKENG